MLATSALFDNVYAHEGEYGCTDKTARNDHPALGFGANQAAD
jgi:hypothetical protein